MFLMLAALWETQAVAAAPLDSRAPASQVTRPRFSDASDQRSQLTPLADDAGYLVAQVRGLTPESVKALGISEPSAVIMLQVTAGGPAGKAGVKPGDVILAIDELSGLNTSTFIEAVRKKKPGDIIRLEILREGEHRSLTAALTGIIEASKLTLQNDSAERGFAAEAAIAEIFPREKFPVEWAVARNNAGHYASLFVDRTTAENIDEAIAAYEDALSVPEFKSHDAWWAMAQESLGSAYQRRLNGDRADNIERAIKAFQAALTVRIPAATPKLWARDEQLLAAAYSARREGERADNIEEAIKAYQAALTVVTFKSDSSGWSFIEAGLADAYAGRVKGDPSDNNELAIKAYEAALSAPGDRLTGWAGLQRKLGAAYEVRTKGKRTENLTRAAKAYEAALTVFTEAAYPEEHAQVEQLKNWALADLSSPAKKRTPRADHRP